MFIENTKSIRLRNYSFKQDTSQHSNTHLMMQNWCLAQVFVLELWEECCKNCSIGLVKVFKSLLSLPLLPFCIPYS